MAASFYSGDLQSGIALAVREKKTVACFITDEGTISREWEEEYFSDPRVVAFMEEKAVALRILSNSQEAGFLRAYHPIKEVPSLIIIRYDLPTIKLRTVH